MGRRRYDLDFDPEEEYHRQRRNNEDEYNYGGYGDDDIGEITGYEGDTRSIDYDREYDIERGGASDNDESGEITPNTEFEVWDIPSAYDGMSEEDKEVLRDQRRNFFQKMKKKAIEDRKQKLEQDDDEEYEENDDENDAAAEFLKNQQNKTKVNDTTDTGATGEDDKARKQALKKQGLSDDAIEDILKHEKNNKKSSGGGGKNEIDSSIAQYLKSRGYDDASIEQFIKTQDLNKKQNKNDEDLDDASYKDLDPDRQKKKKRKRNTKPSSEQEDGREANKNVTRDMEPYFKHIKNERNLNKLKELNKELNQTTAERKKLIQNLEKPGDLEYESLDSSDVGKPNIDLEDLNLDPDRKIYDDVDNRQGISIIEPYFNNLCRFVELTHNTAEVYAFIKHIHNDVNEIEDTVEIDETQYLKDIVSYMMKSTKAQQKKNAKKELHFEILKTAIYNIYNHHKNNLPLEQNEEEGPDNYLDAIMHVMNMILDKVGTDEDHLFKDKKGGKMYDEFELLKNRLVRLTSGLLKLRLNGGHVNLSYEFEDMFHALLVLGRAKEPSEQDVLDNYKNMAEKFSNEPPQSIERFTASILELLIEIHEEKHPSMHYLSSIKVLLRDCMELLEDENISNERIEDIKGTIDELTHEHSADWESAKYRDPNPIFGKTKYQHDKHREDRVFRGDRDEYGNLIQTPIKPSTRGEESNHRNSEKTDWRRRLTVPA